MSAPKFSVGDVVLHKELKVKVQITEGPITRRHGEPVINSHGDVRLAASGQWYKYTGSDIYQQSLEKWLTPIPDASEWSFTDLMEEIKSGSGVDA